MAGSGKQCVHAIGMTPPTTLACIDTGESGVYRCQVCGGKFAGHYTPLPDGRWTGGMIRLADKLATPHTR